MFNLSIFGRKSVKIGGSKMEYHDYVTMFSKRFSNVEKIKISQSLVTVSYEEIFKIQ